MIENIFENPVKYTLGVAVVFCALTWYGVLPNYSEGSRVGVVTKLSHKGLIFKSWEGSINQGGTKITRDSDGNSQVVPNATDFSVVDNKVVDSLTEAYKTGKRVEITYTQWLFAPISQSTTYTITDVKILD